jgi:hypothetical protein
MTLILTNTSGRLKAFTLSHESYCAARGRCACATTPGRDARRVPSSLTLAAGARLEGVDEAVLAVPEVARALRAGELRVERTPPPPARPLAPDSNNRRAGKRTRGDA